MARMLPREVELVLFQIILEALHTVTNGQEEARVNNLSVQSRAVAGFAVIYTHPERPTHLENGEKIMILALKVGFI